MHKYIAIILLMLSLSSCDFVSSILHDDKVVARVGKEKLYKSELEQVIPDMISPEDSAALASRYINSWAMDHLYLQVAEEQMSKSEIDVSEELETYRLSLVKYRYEQRYVNDRLDTLITDEQISEYYEAHKSDFDLARPILKVRFVHVMKDSPSAEELLDLVASGDNEDLQRADTLALASALRYVDNSDRWMDAQALSRYFGVNVEDLLKGVKNNTIRYEPEGRGDVLFAYICDIQDSGVAPIDYCAGTIRDIILSGRKHDLLKGLEQDLLNSALEKNKIEIY